MYVCIYMYIYDGSFHRVKIAVAFVESSNKKHNNDTHDHADNDDDDNYDDDDDADDDDADAFDDETS